MCSAVGCCEHQCRPVPQEWQVGLRNPWLDNYLPDRVSGRPASITDAPVDIPFVFNWCQLLTQECGVVLCRPQKRPGAEQENKVEATYTRFPVTDLETPRSVQLHHQTRMSLLLPPFEAVPVGMFASPPSPLPTYLPSSPPRRHPSPVFSMLDVLTCVCVCVFLNPLHSTAKRYWMRSSTT